MPKRQTSRDTKPGADIRRKLKVAPLDFDFDLQAVHLAGGAFGDRGKAARLTKRTQIINELNSSNPDIPACIMTLLELIPE